MQQRGISDGALDLLMYYGRPAHDHQGHVLLHLDRRAQRAVLREHGRKAGKVIERVRGLLCGRASPSLLARSAAQGDGIEGKHGGRSLQIPRLTS
jgi:hypothetical protein